MLKFINPAKNCPAKFSICFSTDVRCTLYAKAIKFRNFQKNGLHGLVRSDFSMDRVWQVRYARVILKPFSHVTY